MRLIDADALYERLRDDEDLARQRVIDTPNSFPNGMLNPAAVRYMAQLSERTRFKEIVYDAPTIEPERKTGKWEEREVLSEKVIDEWQSARCSVCGRYHTTPYMYYFDSFSFCPNCGAQMEE